MNNSKKFNDVLNECLDRMLQGESVEQCLQRYPELAGELEPLLRTAQVARKAAAVQPGAEFKARARYEFQSALHEMQAKKGRHSPFFTWHWQWQSGWAIALIVILVLVISGSGTALASGSSMPDNTLYSVKLAVEKVQMAFTFSDIGKAELNAEFADKRVEEIIYLASKGNSQNVQVVAQRLNSNLVTMNSLVGDDGSLKRSEMTLNDAGSQNNAFSQRSMTNASAGAPPSAAAGGGVAAPAASVAIAAAPSPTMQLNVPQSQKGVDLSEVSSRFYPEPGATGVSPQPVFQWVSVSGAISYDFQIADKPVFNSPLVDLAGLTQTNWTYVGILDYGRIYYWRIRAIDAGDVASQWIPNQFTVMPMLSLPVPAPAAGAVAPAITVPESSASQNVRGAPGSGNLNENQGPIVTTESLNLNGADNNASKIDELENLKQSISTKAINNKALLEQALETVSPDVRPALRQALAQALAEYDKAIRIIDNSINELK